MATLLPLAWPPTHVPTRDLQAHTAPRKRPTCRIVTARRRCSACSRHPLQPRRAARTLPPSPPLRRQAARSSRHRAKGRGCAKFAAEYMRPTAFRLLAVTHNDLLYKWASFGVDGANAQRKSVRFDVAGEVFAFREAFAQRSGRQKAVRLTALKL